MTDIIMQAYHVLDEIKNDPMYQSIKALDRLIEKKYEVEIRKYQIANLSYQKMMSEGGTYHPDYHDIITLFGHTKSTLYQKQEVIQYFEFERQFQEQLDLFLKVLSQSVSKHIVTPNKMGIVIKGGSCHVHQ